MGLFKPNVEKLKENKKINGLIKALRYKENQIRRSAAEALVRIEEWLVDPLLIVGWSRNNLFQIETVEALEMQGRVLEHLIAVLNDLNECVQMIVALRELSKRVMEFLLIGALKNKDAGVRMRAAEAVVKIGASGKNSLMLLEVCAQAPDPDVRQVAQDALAKIRGK